MMRASTPEIRSRHRAGIVSGICSAVRLAPKHGRARVFLLISIKPIAAPAAMPPGARKDTSPMTDHTHHPPRRALTLDLAYYQSHLDSADYTDDEKRALIEALWTIIVAFVDLGYGIHPAQQG